MNTPTHMIMGGALWGKRDRAGSFFASFAGGLAPDLPMLAMVFYATRVAGVPRETVFSSLYFSESWQRVFAVDHSFALWMSLLGVGILRRLFPLIAFAGSGMTHAVVDFLTHHTDARPQLWPFSNWRFQSPISYWDGAYFGNLVAPFEALLVLMLTVVLLVRSDRVWERLLTIAIAAIFLVPIGLTGGFHGLHGLG